MAITDVFRPVKYAPLRVKSRAVPGFFCPPYGRHEGDSWPKFEWNRPIVDVCTLYASPPALSTRAREPRAPLCFTKEPHTTGQAKFALSPGPLCFENERRLWGIPISERRIHILESFHGTTARITSGEEARFPLQSATKASLAVCPLPGTREARLMLLERRRTLKRNAVGDPWHPKRTLHLVQAVLVRVLHTRTLYWS